MQKRALQLRSALVEWLSSPTHSAILIFAIAFGLRLILLFALYCSPYWSHQLVDAKLYDDWARQLAAGREAHPAPYFYSPLYPWALSVAYRLFGHTPGLIRLLQCTAGSVLCVLIYLPGRRLLTHWAALGAGLFCALCGPLIFFDNLLLKTASVSFFLLAAVTLLYIEPKTRRLSLGRFFLAGAAFGLTAGLRGNVIMVAAAVLLFLVIEAVRRRTHTFSPVLFAAGLVVAILPLTVSNYAASGELVLTTYSGGYNFYEGNSAEAGGYHPAVATVRQTAEHELPDVRAGARAVLGRGPTPSEVSAYWSTMAWRDIGEQPGRWLRLLAFKTALFANHAEIPDNYNYQFMSGQLSPLRCNPVGFYLLAPLAIAGLGMAMARGGRWRLIVLVVLAYAGSVIIFYVTARYRVPLVGLLAILAALAVEQVVAWFAARDYRKALAAAVAVVGLFIVVAMPLVPSELGFGREYYALGIIQHEEGRYESAIASYLHALDYQGASAQLENNLGAAYLRAAARTEAADSSRLAAALRHLRRAVELNPSYFEAWKNLGIALAAIADPEGAKGALLEALRLAPDTRTRERVRRVLKSVGD